MASLFRAWESHTVQKNLFGLQYVPTETMFFFHMWSARVSLPCRLSWQMFHCCSVQGCALAKVMSTFLLIRELCKLFTLKPETRWNWPGFSSKLIFWPDLPKEPQRFRHSVQVPPEQPRSRAVPGPCWTDLKIPFKQKLILFPNGTVASTKPLLCLGLSHLLQQLLHMAGRWVWERIPAAAAGTCSGEVQWSCCGDGLLSAPAACVWAGGKAASSAGLRVCKLANLIKRTVSRTTHSKNTLP